jgi:uncharacterized integral membrane protein
MKEIGPKGVDWIVVKVAEIIDTDMYLSTAIGLTPGGNSTVHIYTQAIHRTTQSTTKQYE